MTFSVRDLMVNVLPAAGAERQLNNCQPVTIPPDDDDEKPDEPVCQQGTQQPKYEEALQVGAGALAELHAQLRQQLYS
jgi:hypothetical protein